MLISYHVLLASVILTAKLTVSVPVVPSQRDVEPLPPEAVGDRRTAAGGIPDHHPQQRLSTERWPHLVLPTVLTICALFMCVGLVLYHRIVLRMFRQPSPLATCTPRSRSSIYSRYTTRQPLPDQPVQPPSIPSCQDTVIIGLVPDSSVSCHWHPPVYFPVTPRSEKQVDSDGFYSVTFSSDGGTLSPGEVALTVPILSIPPGHTYDIKMKTHTNLKYWESCIDVGNGETIISAVSEYHVEGGQTFENHVTIVTPHIVQDEEKIPFIRVWWGDSNKRNSFTAIPHMSERRADEVAYFLTDENHVFIHTRSFKKPHFVCTINDRDIPLDLQALVLYDLETDQDLRIRVRLCDRRTSIPEFRQELFKDETMTLIEQCSWRPVGVPKGRLTDDCQFSVEVKPVDHDWVSRTIGTGLTFPLTQTRNVSDIIEWQTNPLADFLLVANRIPPRPFQGVIVVRVSGECEESLGPGHRGDHDIVYQNSACMDVPPRRTLDGRCKQQMWSCTTKIDVNLPFEKYSRARPAGPQVRSGGPQVARPATANPQPKVSRPGTTLTLQDAFEHVSRRLALKESYKFYRRLGLHEAEVDSIKEGYKDHFEEQKMQALLQWRRREGCRASVASLVACLRGADAVSLADELQDGIKNISYSSRSDVDRPPAGIHTTESGDR